MPTHIAIILDGNRRWAKENGLTSFQGHSQGFENIRSLAPQIFKRGVKYLSVFAFSNENFKRSADEVNYLMNIFVEMFQKECDKLHKENIKIVFSGRRSRLRDDVLESMDRITELTKDNTQGTFNICLNYGGQQEIIDATKKIAEEVRNGSLTIENINENTIYEHLYQNLPPIDLMIRTSGECRISNFMLWQLSYAEMFFTHTYFPAFTIEEFDQIVDEFLKRDRRFGGNNEKKNN